MNIKRNRESIYMLVDCEAGDIVRFLDTDDYYLLAVDQETGVDYVLVRLGTGEFITLDGDTEMLEEKVERFCSTDCVLVLDREEKQNG